MTVGPKAPPFPASSEDPVGLSGISTPFAMLSQIIRVDYPRVTHPCATLLMPEGHFRVRLACVKHAASVRSEPGSNSPVV